ncbi:unnamed protein product [Effrenium voratum]|nr:unnamed protein product [Effrenium voratum]
MDAERASRLEEETCAKARARLLEQRRALDTEGFVVLQQVLSQDTIERLRSLVQGDLESLWPEGFIDCTPTRLDALPAMRVVDLKAMNFGYGKFAYLAEPLPSPLNALRAALYEVLVPVANTQKEMFRAEIAPKQLKLEEFPPRILDLWEICKSATPPQRLPTSICLRYCPTGCMQPHRDLQGSVMFPFQAMLPLSDPGTDYEGGRFFVQPGKRDVGRQYCQELLTGDLIIFRSGLYHGVEPLTRGRRFAIAMQFALSHLNENPSLPRRTWEEKMELEKQQSAQTELEQPPLG